MIVGGELAAELTDPQVLALGLREGARLVAAVRLRIEDEAAELGRLVVAPDREGQGLGSRLLRLSDRCEQLDQGPVGPSGPRLEAGDLSSTASTRSVLP
ncbi:MAG: GNAT family N-acetyltransferase [Pseudonocardiaceae bacterium]